jgi:hypothetical protein
MLVPFFNFYWFGVAVAELTRQTNRALKAQGLPPLASVRLATAATAAPVLVFMITLLWFTRFFVGNEPGLLFILVAIIVAGWLLAQTRAIRAVVRGTAADPDWRVHSLAFAAIVALDVLHVAVLAVLGYYLRPN